MSIESIIGETVTVHTKTKTGTDALNVPTYSWASEDVENVLVTPGTLHDVDGTIRPDGVKVAYTLHFPKLFHKSLRGAEVTVRGQRFRVIGDPKPYTAANTPTLWWLPVEVEAVNG